MSAGVVRRWVCGTGTAVDAPPLVGGDNEIVASAAGVALHSKGAAAAVAVAAEACSPLEEDNYHHHQHS